MGDKSAEKNILQYILSGSLDLLTKPFDYEKGKFKMK